MSEAGSILRLISCNETSATALRRAILTHFDSNNSKCTSKLSINNKYFAASVTLLTAGVVETNECTTSWIEDGILLIFPEDKGVSNFDACVKAFDDSKDADYGDTLRLCTALNSGDNAGKRDEKAYEKEYGRRVLWCLDHGFEYVEACDLSDISVGHDAREKEGFARVAEAIGSTIWTSAKMHPRGNAVSSKPAVPFVAAVVPKVDNGNTANIIEESSDGAGDDSVKTKPKEFIDDTKNESAFDSFEKLMGEAKAVREEALGGNLPDEVRRQRAEETAMKLVDLLGSMDLDDDDDDSSTESET